ncbi:hypothetical protein AAVH_38611, partial [Aphelenchoides avenae]
FHHYCTDGGCGIYQDGLNAILAERTCLEGASSNLALSGIVAQALASYCGYSDATCSLGMTTKEGSAYGGFYYHRECGAEITTVFEDCSRQIGINYTHSYDTTCDKDQYITDMASSVTQAMDYTDCGASCSAPPAELQRIPVRYFHVQRVDDPMVHVHDDGGEHNTHDDGGADHDRVAKLVHNAGDNDDAVNQYNGDHDCSDDVDNGDIDYNDRSFNEHHCGRDY